MARHRARLRRPWCRVLRQGCDPSPMTTLGQSRRALRRKHRKIVRHHPGFAPITSRNSIEMATALRASAGRTVRSRWLRHIRESP
jgi:hypothetical protein